MSKRQEKEKHLSKMVCVHSEQEDDRWKQGNEGKEGAQPQERQEDQGHHRADFQSWAGSSKMKLNDTTSGRFTASLDLYFPFYLFHQQYEKVKKMIY